MPTAKPTPRGKGKRDTSNICFVISPIGSDGTDIHRKFKDVLDYVIKPAVEKSGYDLKVIRADDIKQSGSIIKDILQSLLESYVVIADLTNQNPNVFYELGVRHALKPRTILISEKADDIPFDLKDYRTIIYENTAKGVSIFHKKIKEFLDAMKKDPDRPDNPVLDKIGSIIEGSLKDLQNENTELRERLNALAKGDKPTKKESVAPKNSDIFERVKRILALLNADRQIFSGSFSKDVGGKKVTFTQPAEQGRFQLYYVMPKDKNIDYAIYLSESIREINLDEEFADIRVLLERNAQGQEMQTRFVIATITDLSKKREEITKKFEKLLKFIPSNQRGYFSLEIWDEAGLSRQEKKLGLKI